MSENESTLVLLARIEGKLDLVIASQKATDVRVDDHEGRLRSLEARPFVSPWKLWTSLLGTATFIVAVLNIISWMRGM